jgi:Predicted hydrolase (HAD superfamily)
VFTNGTDYVPEEIELLGLTPLFDRILNSADFGIAKPDPQAFAAAHRVIEADLGHPIARSDVWFTDDRPDNVEAAREFGWDAELFTQ